MLFKQAEALGNDEKTISSELLPWHWLEIVRNERQKNKWDTEAMTEIVLSMCRKSIYAWSFCKTGSC